MKISVMGGAEFDVVSNDELAGALKGASDSIVDRLRPQAERISRKYAVQAGTVDAGGNPLVLPLLVVPPEAQVSLSLVTVQLGDDHTTGAGVPVVYFGGQASSTPNRGDIIAIGGTNSLPYVVSWDEKTIWGHAGDQCFVIVYGVAAGTNVLATLRYHEWLSGSSDPRRL